MSGAAQADAGSAVPERPVGWRVWLLASRPRTLPAAVAPVLVGSALALHDSVFDPLAAAICLGFALLIQIGTNFANDYYDFMQGADTSARVGPRRAVAAGWVTPRAMRRAMILTFTTAFLLGLTLIAWGGPWLLAVGVASIVCGIAYTGGPWPLGYHGLGDLFVFIFFGLIAVGATYFVQALDVTDDVVFAAVPIGLLATNILVVNNYRDVETDRLAGKRTLVVRLGRGFARMQHAAGLLVAFAVPVWFAIRDEDWTRLLPVLLLPLAIRNVQRLNHATQPLELIALLGDTGKFLGLYAVLFGASLVR